MVLSHRWCLEDGRIGPLFLGIEDGRIGQIFLGVEDGRIGTCFLFSSLSSLLISRLFSLLFIDFRAFDAGAIGRFWLPPNRGLCHGGGSNGGGFGPAPEGRGGADAGGLGPSMSSCLEHSWPELCKLVFGIIDMEVVRPTGAESGVLVPS